MALLGTISEKSLRYYIVNNFKVWSTFYHYKHVIFSPILSFPNCLYVLSILGFYTLLSKQPQNIVVKINKIFIAN